MTLNHRTLRAAPAVIPLTTARFDMNAPDGGLTTPADGLLLPIVVGIVALVAALLVVAMVRRRQNGQPAAEAVEADDASETLGSPLARDRNLPRWLDPAVAAARFRTDTTIGGGRAGPAVANAPARTPTVFSGPVDELVDRAVVRYEGVPLLDRPDDVLGQVLRELDGGDEVEVIERAEIWARVRTPNGASGWLPSMTLSAVATLIPDDDPGTEDPDPPSPPGPVEEPLALESILEAIVAQRLARPRPDATISVEAPVTAGAEPSVPKRARSRKPKSDQPAAGRRARPETTKRQ